MTASYVHFYFPSNPSAVAALFAPDLQTAIASKLAPTLDSVFAEDADLLGEVPSESDTELRSNVGASLLAKRP
jgi:cobyrinic acid a,c-diamide synthase